MDITTNHKPPYNFEYVFSVGKTKYIVTAQVLRDKHKVAYVTFGRLTAKRMRPLRVKASDYRQVFSKVFGILGDILDNSPKVKAFMFAFPAGYERMSKSFNMLLKRYMNRNPSLKLKLYMRSTEDRTDFLMVRKPYDDKKILGDDFHEADIDLRPMRRVKPIKVVVKDNEGNEKEVDVDVDDNVREIVEKVTQNPELFNKLESLSGIDENTIEKMIKREDEKILEMSKHYDAVVDKLNYMREFAGKWYSTVAFYTGFGYDTLHSVLRLGKSIEETKYPEGYKKYYSFYIRKVFDLFREAPKLEENMHVIRTLSAEAWEMFEKYETGDYFVDPGLTYTSFKPFISNFGYRYIVMNILLPKGTRCLMVDGLSSHAVEKEITLSPGSVFKILKKELKKDNSGAQYMYFEAVYVGNVRDEVAKTVESKLTESNIPKFEVGDKIKGYGIVYHVFDESMYLLFDEKVKTFEVFKIYKTHLENEMEVEKVEIIDGLINKIELAKSPSDTESGKIYVFGIRSFGGSQIVKVKEPDRNSQCICEKVSNGEEIKFENLLYAYDGYVELNPSKVKDILK